MTKPPELIHLSASAEELAELFNRQDVKDKLSTCRQTRTPILQDPLHEKTCCKGEFIHFNDPDTGEEFALLAEYVFVDPARPKNPPIIRFVRIGSNVHNLRLV
jgi:hypothetical protein